MKLNRQRLCILFTLVFALSISWVIAEVELPNGSFHLNLTEMSLKTAGIDLKITRNWYN